MEIVLTIVGLFAIELLFVALSLLSLLALATIYALIKPHIAVVVNLWLEWFHERTDI